MKLKSYAAITHQGPYLEVNEDAYDFDLNQHLFFVLDGFGGTGIGDRAVKKMSESLKDFLTHLTDDPNATMPLYWNARWLVEGNALVNAMLNAHQNLFKENAAKPFNQRAGASAALALKAGPILVLAHVGACQVYLIRYGQAHSLFIPDTHHYLSVDPLSPQALRLPAGAFGLNQELSWSMREVRIQAGDQFVFLSEGIASWVSPAEISHGLSRSEDLQQRLNGLLKLSNNRGNSANQTGMVLEF